jgi:hypothetical protein
MRCRRYEQWMVELLDTPGNDPAWESLNEHLGGCSQCRESLRMLQFSKQLLEQPANNAEMGPYFIPRLMARIREAQEENELDWGLVWRYSRQLVAVSSLILLFLTGTLFFQLTQVSPESPVVVDSIMEPSFTDRAVNDILLQTEKPQPEQVLEALLSSGGGSKR